MSFAYKEWTLVCDALASGEQSILVRKGGIHEGCDSFSFWHSEFFLFPTFYHQQMGRLRLPPDARLPERNGLVHVGLFAQIEWARFAADIEVVEEISPFHIWTDEEIKKRFSAGTTDGVHIAFVRIFQLHEPWVLRDSPSFRGCRSWVELPKHGPGRLAEAVLEKSEHRERGEALLEILDCKHHGKPRAQLARRHG